MWTTAWSIDQTAILSRRELARIIASLERTAGRSASTHMNLVIVRLACCCGLRASEIADLRLADVHLDGSWPHLHVRNGKGGKERKVPLWWDANTLQAMGNWRAVRRSDDAGDQDLFVCSMRQGTFGRRLTRHMLRRRFQRACRVLDEDRRRSVTIHHGRHTFVSHALAGGRSLAEVRMAAGHGNVSVTSMYLHVEVDDHGEVGRLFG